jgi:hypothetical protein
MTDREDILPEANANLRAELAQLKSRNNTMRLLVQRQTDMITQAKRTLQHLEQERASIQAEFTQLQQSAA